MLRKAPCPRKHSKWPRLPLSGMKLPHAFRLAFPFPPQRRTPSGDKAATAHNAARETSARSRVCSVVGSWPSSRRGAFASRKCAVCPDPPASSHLLPKFTSGQHFTASKLARLDIQSERVQACRSEHHSSSFDYSFADVGKPICRTVGPEPRQHVSVFWDIENIPPSKESVPRSESGLKVIMRGVKPAST